MFHKSSMGRFGEGLPTDLNGFVPQEGDRAEDFTWDPRRAWTPESWSLFVDQAIQATQRAEEQLRLTSERAADGLVIVAADIASQAREGRQGESREIFQALRAMTAQADRLANLFESRQKATGRADAHAKEFDEIVGRLHAVLKKVEMELS